ncbi:unnamed protein product, partial [Medioppia subpectinata]
YFADPVASKYTQGTAIHWYGHDPKEQLDAPHNQHPDKWMLATEACVEGGVKLGDWNTADLYASDILGDLLHHVIGWVDWNMALDTQGGPNWCKNWVDAPLIINPDLKEYYRQPSFYAMAHFSKFLAPGSVRVDTPVVNQNNNHGLVGGFRRPDGSIVIIAVNTEDIEIDLIVEDDKAAGKLIQKIAPRSVQTYKPASTKITMNYFLTVTLVIAALTINTHGLKPSCANHKQFGHDSIVCVCSDAKPCDSLQGPTKTAPGVLTRWESTAEGNRFVRTELKLAPKDQHVDLDQNAAQLHVKLNRDVKHQQIIGFGGAFTDSTGINIKKMGAKSEDHLIGDCFGKEGLEYNMGRIPIGGSDFSTRAYSLDDNTNDDKPLAKFNLTQEDLDLKIPIIQKAMKVATHDIRLFGSPWSAPKWMKTNNELIHGGDIKGQYLDVYAKYFVKYLDAYKAHGLNHWGITVQNEPWASQRWNSMHFDPKSMASFVANHLGPELARSGYGVDKLQVMQLDHNVGIVKQWVNEYFADPVASKYTAGTAVHWYGHDPKEQLDAPHNQHPDKWMLATEACVEGGVKLGDWNTANLYATDILGDLLHHVIGWVDWNMVLDTQGGPNWTNNFVDAPLIINPQLKEYYRQPSYYAMAHFSKFLAPGSVRVDTPIVTQSNNKALVGGFRRSDGSTVVIAVNTENIEIDFIVEDSKAAGKLVQKIAPRSVQTYVYYD